MTVINIENRLKLIATTHKKKQQQKSTRGSNAIKKLAHYNEIAKRLNTMMQDAYNESDAQFRVLAEPYSWYLEELLEHPIRSAMDEFIAKQAETILAIIEERQEEFKKLPVGKGE
jgi:hypothetical protein